MAITKQEMKENIIEELNFRYGCFDLAMRSEAPNLQAERGNYNGLTKMLELCGYDWERNEKGEHKIYQK
jgi:hypothetical protein